ncbi:hypothetical protein [Streptomyces pseudogriseolus]|uniref:hypothetical protein n=1 Tax=Streptomyces pseudogriseolus TaxID=36817 RepID=UPI003FA1BCD1|nr:hypothetical protein [Streptomyces pseudogriseolus]
MPFVCLKCGEPVPAKHGYKVAAQEHLEATGHPPVGVLPPKPKPKPAKPGPGRAAYVVVALLVLLLITVLALFTEPDQGFGNHKPCGRLGAPPCG